jgi:hypothetical protein
MQDLYGTALKFSTVAHPQIDGQSEWVIQILEDMLRACASILGISGSIIWLMRNSPTIIVFNAR